MSRVRYFVFRTLQTIFMLWLLLTLLFFLFRLLPGDYVDVMLATSSASPEKMAAIRAQWGFDDPLYVQYFRYITNLTLNFELGESYFANKPVEEYLRMKLWNTFILFAPAVTTGYLLGAIAGTIMGSNRGSKIDDFGIIPLIFASSFPSFFTAIILVIVFAGWLNIFPTNSLVSPHMYNEFKDAPWWRIYVTKDFLMHYILPFSAIVLRYLSGPALVMRTSLVEVLGQNFSFYYRITGLPRTRRLWHLGKHASLPLITLYPISMARAIGGLVLIETVFNWPGMGFTLVQSIGQRDYPVIQIVFFLIAAFVIIANFAVDIVYGVIDPRVTVED